MKRMKCSATLKKEKNMMNWERTGNTTSNMAVRPGILIAANGGAGGSSFTGAFGRKILREMAVNFLIFLNPYLVTRLLVLADQIRDPNGHTPDRICRLKWK